MNQVLFIICGMPVTVLMAAGLGLAAVLAMLMAMAVLTAKASRQTQDNSQAAMDRQRDPPVRSSEGKAGLARAFRYAHGIAKRRGYE